MSQTPPHLPPLSYATPASGGPPQAVSSRLKWVWIGLPVFLVFVCVLLSMVRRDVGYQYLPLSEFHHAMVTGNVAEVAIEGDSLSGKLVRPVPVTTPTGTISVTSFRTELPSGTCNWQFIQWVLENRGSARVDIVNSNNFLTQVVAPLIPWILILGFVAFLLRRTAKAAKLARSEPTRVILLNPESKQ